MILVDLLRPAFTVRSLVESNVLAGASSSSIPCDIHALKETRNIYPH